MNALTAKRAGLIAASLSMLGIILLAWSSREPQPVGCERCNIVFIQLDSVRPDHMSVYGYERETTPHMKALARDSFVFEQYFSTSYLTPISAVSTLTGRYPSGNGVRSFYSALRDDTTTLAETLREAGYSTAAFGSSPEYFVFPSLGESVRRGFETDRIYAPDSKGREAWRDHIPLDDIRSWIADRRGQPFFLWLPIGAAHWPYGMNQSYTFTDQDYGGFLRNMPLGFKTFSRIYDGRWYPIREGTMPYFKDTLAIPQFRETLPKEDAAIRQHAPTVETALTPADEAFIRGRYDDGILLADKIVGDVVSLLKAEGIYEDTIIVIDSVHGDALGEQGYYGHYDIHDTTIRNPLIIRVPGARGRKVSAMTSGVDLYPTILSIAGVSYAARDGLDFRPFLSGDAAEPRDAVYISRTPIFETLFTVVGDPVMEKRYDALRREDAAQRFQDSAIRTREWKLIHRTSREALARYSWWATLTGEALRPDEYELYDLKNDPWERENVFERYPEVALELKKRLDAWEQEQAAYAPTRFDTERQDYF